MPSSAIEEIARRGIPIHPMTVSPRRMRKLRRSASEKRECDQRRRNGREMMMTASGVRRTRKGRQIKVTSGYLRGAVNIIPMVSKPMTAERMLAMRHVFTEMPLSPQRGLQFYCALMSKG